MTGSRPRSPDEYSPIISYPMQRRIEAVIKYVLIGIVVFIFVFPMFWMFSSALRPASELYTNDPSLLPNSFDLVHFQTLITESDYVRQYINSIIVATGVVSLTTVTATLGGYGLSRIDIPYKVWYARSVLFGYMFPPILLAIPMFILWRNLGILNSFPGLILAETAISLPFGLWLMWKFFDTVPYSMEESARMEGATRFRAFYEIALPMAKPGIIAVAVFAYAVAWNEYTIPKVIMSEPNKWVLTLGIEQLRETGRVFWGQVMAASVGILLPSFLFVFVLQKYILRGFRTVEA